MAAVPSHRQPPDRVGNSRVARRSEKCGGGERLACVEDALLELAVRDLESARLELSSGEGLCHAGRRLCLHVAGLIIRAFVGKPQAYLAGRQRAWHGVTFGGEIGSSRVLQGHLRLRF